MTSTTTSYWYLAPPSSPNTFDPAASAFEEGLRIFQTKLTADPKKRAHTLKVTKLQDVLDRVSKAQSLYETKSPDPGTRKCIVAFSKRVHHYGNIMDVMVQHHPEYVSLAWGAMKIVFGAIIEHEKIGTTIVSAMCEIADALAQVELAETLYPTLAMKQTIALLYSYIIKFLLRALAWYETSTISRAIQSFTRPAALRYVDLIEDIRKTTSKANDLSVAGSQAEQRDMHDKLREVYKQQIDLLALLPHLQTQLEEMRRQFEHLLQQANQNQQSTATTLALVVQEIAQMKQNITDSHVDIRHTLSDIQFTQALTFITSSCPIDHKTHYEQALTTRRRRKFSSQAKCVPFWTSPMLQAWDTAASSSFLRLKATYRDRLNVLDFSTNLIEQLLHSRVAVLWVLKAQQEPPHTVFHVLKSLILQVLTLDCVPRTDTVLNFHLRNFQTAHSASDYISILGELLERFDRVYVTIDVDAVAFESSEECRELLKTLAQTMVTRSAGTVMKVIFVDYRPGRALEDQGSEKVLRIGRTAQRKAKRIPTKPLRGNASSAARGRSTGISIEKVN